jgi:hypothetical protein
MSRAPARGHQPDSSATISPGSGESSSRSASTLVLPSKRADPRSPPPGRVNESRSALQLRAAPPPRASNTPRGHSRRRSDRADSVSTSTGKPKLADSSPVAVIGPGSSPGTAPRMVVKAGDIGAPQSTASTDVSSVSPFHQTAARPHAAPSAEICGQPSRL